MHWISEYISLKHVVGGRGRDGVDCWGLLYLIYRERFGKELPIYPGLVTGSIWSIHEAIMCESATRWREIALPVDGCAVGLSHRQVIHHVGIWIDADGGKVVHVQPGGVLADTIKSLRLKGFRVIKFYGLHN